MLVKSEAAVTHSLLMEMQNGTVSLEDSLAVSYKAKPRLYI